MTREKLIAALKAKYGVSYTDHLMDALQDLGLIADSAVRIDDVPDQDLLRAYTQPLRSTKP